MSLDDAQLAKKRHLAAKLVLKPDLRVLDIGSGWGGLGALSRGDDGRERHWRHAVGRAVAAPRPHAREERNLSSRVAFKLEDYRDVAGPLRPHRLGRHVRACRRRLLRRFLQALCRAARGRRRHGAAFDRPLGRTELHEPVDRQIHFPRRLHSFTVGGDAGHRARGTCWSPTSRFSACTTPRRSRPGASASSPIARRSSASTTRVL